MYLLYNIHNQVFVSVSMQGFRACNLYKTGGVG